MGFIRALGSKACDQESHMGDHLVFESTRKYLCILCVYWI